jgi:hypothetical protein
MPLLKEQAFRKAKHKKKIRIYKKIILQLCSHTPLLYINIHVYPLNFVCEHFT